MAVVTSISTPQMEGHLWEALFLALLHCTIVIAQKASLERIAKVLVSIVPSFVMQISLLADALLNFLVTRHHRRIISDFRKTTATATATSEW